MAEDSAEPKSAPAISKIAVKEVNYTTETESDSDRTMTEADQTCQLDQSKQKPVGEGNS